MGIVLEERAEGEYYAVPLLGCCAGADDRIA